MPVADFAAEDCLLAGRQTSTWKMVQVMRAGKYLAPVHWVKTNGMGNWFVHRSQTILFGYRQKPVSAGRWARCFRLATEAARRSRTQVTN